MKSSLLFVLCFLIVGLSLQSSAQSLWSQSINKHESYFASKNAALIPSAYKLMNVNTAELKRLQSAIPFISNETNGIAFEIPMPDGSMFKTAIVETQLWSNQSIPLNAGIRTYTLFDPSTKSIAGNVTIWKDGIDGVVFSKEGSVFIKPLYDGNEATHMIFYNKDLSGAGQQCLVEEGIIQQFTLQGRTDAGDCKKRVYRIAIAGTGEYTSWAGGVSGAVAHITSTINTVNSIYTKDVNVTFTIVSGTNTIYTDASSDPYGTVSSAALNENQINLDNTVGPSNYDVGMVFSNGWGGGIAQLSSVCGPNKARGASGTLNNSAFSTTVAHELGHMFGAGHTFSSTNGGCNGNISMSSSWEPGGGSTILSYGASCAPTSFVSLRDLYFHAGSIGQMQNFIVGSATCATPVTTANQPPSVNSVPGTSFNVPANTPFVLTMSGTDANGDALTYTWEQLNTSNLNPNTQPPSSSSVQGPLFRSYPPTNNPTRYFPNIQSIINNQPPTYEVLPSVARTMNFRGTVRDNSALGGCTAEVDVTLNVHASGGFKVTTPGWGTNSWAQLTGSNTASIVWDVAGTNAAPINCANVDILFSTDGGLTYPTVLAAATPNDGQHNIVIPGVNTSTGRIMVKGSNNVFFSISEEPVFVSHPMPVTFLHFTATKQGNTVNLDWSTATETNSDKFIIERSANGTEFNNQLGSVKAAGNSTTVQRYRFNDLSPMNKWNYYRLKQLDTDGKYAYSKTASVYFDKEAFLSVYPNPVRDVTTIEFMTAQAGKINIEVYDSKGSLMIRTTYNPMAGMNRTSVNMESFSKGIYTLKCYTEKNTLGVMKLIKE